MLGLGLEGMDILLLSFALSSIIHEFHISSAAGGVLPSITNIGMMVGGVIFGYWADRNPLSLKAYMIPDGVHVRLYYYSGIEAEAAGCLLAL